ncbi:MAG: GntR family transcriptional regulator [Holophagales bacterium]|nr:GntR family transcriptional regulator [Holophagales bacterium]
MLPFLIELRSGIPIHDQVVYAVRRAIVTGALRPGDRFPSIRAMGKELGINPNTAQRIVSTLTAAGLLEIRPGIGSVISAAPRPDPESRRQLLAGPLEELVVDAKELGLALEEVTEALRGHWQQLQPDPPPEEAS